MQLLPQPVGIVTKGEVLFDGDNLLQKTQRQSTQVRGDGISMVFQDPMTALNPTMRVSHQMMEVIEAHRHVSRRDSANICVEMLERVGIKKDRFYDYPHQLSGGMKQRVVIAMALLCRPRLLIADEPTTALDVTIQAQILEIIRGLIQELRMSMLLITHDLGIVAETCDRIAVMYAGSIVESGAVLDVYSRPKHPYTKGLFDSIPKLNEESIRLKPIEGATPNPADLPSGCLFHPRCKHRQEICSTEMPAVRDLEHTVRCHFDLEQEV
jgi:peptide/nickel transport system ATP-binding protein